MRLVLQYNHFSVIVCLSSRLDGRDAPVPVSLLVFSSSTPSCHQFPTSALLGTRLGWGENDSDNNSVAALCLICVWSVIVLRRPYFAPTISSWLHSSGQPSVFTFLQNGIILQLFLLRPADCRADPLVALRMAQQIPFVSADLHGPCLLPSTCSIEVNDSMQSPRPHRVQSNSNQIKVNPCGPAVRYAVFLFRLCCC